MVIIILKDKERDVSNICQINKKPQPIDLQTQQQQQEQNKTKQANKQQTTN